MSRSKFVFSLYSIYVVQYFALSFSECVTEHCTFSRCSIYCISRSSTFGELHNLLMVLSRHANEVLMVCLPSALNSKHTLTATHMLILFNEYSTCFQHSCMKCKHYGLSLSINLADFHFTWRCSVSGSKAQNRLNRMCVC